MRFHVSIASGKANQREEDRWTQNKKSSYCQVMVWREERNSRGGAGVQREKRERHEETSRTTMRCVGWYFKIAFSVWEFIGLPRG